MAALLLAMLGACTFNPPKVVFDQDAGTLELGVLDAEPPDTGAPDSGGADTGVEDTGVPDTGAPDTGDTGVEDTGVPDTGAPDTGLPDAGVEDAGPLPPVCGNGIVELGEGCDQGGAPVSVACVDCQVATGFVCVSSPSTCAPVGRVRYVDGADPNCGPGGPFCVIDDAIDTGDTDLVVVATSTYTETLDFNGGGTSRAVVAEAGATLTSAGQPLRVRGGAHVIFAGFTITSSGDGAVKAEGNGTTLEMRDCVIGPSPNLGVELKSGARLDLLRSVVRDNATGGLKLNSSGGYAVMNTVIIGNGGAASAVGGVHIENGAGDDRFVNNSLAFNTSSANPGAVWCQAQASLRNVVVWLNTPTNDPGVSVATCDTEYSLLQASLQGQGNISVDPLFIDGLLRPDPTSPVRDVGDPAGTEDVGPPPGPAPIEDRGRVARPQGQRVDMGAYELR